ncbi:lymphocyte function-associated antigen 3 isoform 1-T1 [Dugong dugon]
MAVGSAPGRALRVLRLICLLLWFDFISCVSEGVYGIMNRSVTLKPLRDTVFKEITWKKQKDKIVEWYRDSELRAFPPFQGRILLNTTSGDLTIFNLTSSDEDRYEIESQDLKDSIVFFLSVIELLPSPILNCTLTDKNVIVQCTIPEHYNSHVEFIEYSWNCALQLCNSTSSKLEISFKENDLSQEIQCVLSNRVSKMKSSITLGTCVPNHHSRHRWLLILAVVTSLVIVILMLCGKGILRSCRKTHRPNSS